MLAIPVTPFLDLNIFLKTPFVNRRLRLNMVPMNQKPTTPQPSFWQKQSTRAIAALLAFLLVLRLLWGWWVARQLQSQLAELRQRGQPTDVADLVFPSLPDEHNAWALQSQASFALAPGVDPPRASTLEYPDYPPYPTEWMKLAEASENANRPAFALLRKARQLREVQFHQRITSPVILIALPYLNLAKMAANTLADGAAYAHVTDNDHEAIERSLDLLHLARSLYHDEFMISQLVAMAVDSVACNQIQSMAPGLRLDSSAATRPTTPHKVRQLIDQLLDENPVAQGLQRSLQMEQLICIDYAHVTSQHTWFIRPLADREAIRSTRNMATAIDAASCTTWPQAKKAIDHLQFDRLNNPSRGTIATILSPADGVPRFSRWFNTGGLAVSACLERHFRCLAERRATAISLACQLYRHDYRRWPERLEQLVPNYLPALPPDPFRHDNQTFGYVTRKTNLPGGQDRSMIYFDAGPDVGPPDEPSYAWQVDQRNSAPRLEVIRQYRDLSRFATPPSKKTVDDNPHEPDAPGAKPQPE